MKNFILICLLLMTSLQAKENLCDKLAGNPLDADLDSQGIKFKAIDAVKAIDACQEQLKKDSGAPRTIYQLGRAYLKADKPTKTIEYYTQACESNYASACNSLGLQYYWGSGVKENNEKAKELFQMACNDKKNYLGCYDIGGMYEHGNGVEKDIEKAKSYYMIACQRDYQAACNRYEKLNSN